MFKDRKDAGMKLAKKLKKYKGNPSAVVIGLPRGGVVTAYEVAKILGLPLDIVVPRKIGAPLNEELAIGAITEDGEPALDSALIMSLGVSDAHIEETIEKEKQEANRRLKLYRGKRPKLNLKEKTALLIDDGVATGATMRAAVRSAKIKGSKCVVVAVPVIALDTVNKLKKEADEVVYLDAPDYFGAVGAFYDKFDQTSDEEVINLLNKKNS